jgi:hypothetical protein
VDLEVVEQVAPGKDTDELPCYGAGALDDGSLNDRYGPTRFLPTAFLRY